jgi:hypothetical protein
VAAGSKQLLYRAAFVAVLITGCRNGPKPAATPGDVITPIGAAGPAQFADLPPGDTAAVLDLMRQTMREIDAGLPQMTQRDTTLPPVADSVARHLTVWLQDGVPRKMTSRPDSTANGASDGETDIWFVGGEVAVVQRVADSYALDGGRIVLWTDESLQPRTDVLPAQVMGRENELEALARGWLGVFGLRI